MKHVKRTSVVLPICSLTAFVEKNKLTGGLSESDVASNFKIEPASNGQPASKLGNLEDGYALLSFWASYDVQSRVQNVSLSNVLRSSHGVEIISISFDEHQSIFKETIHKDQIVTPTRFVETEGEDPSLFKKHRLNRGFTNCLLDRGGVTAVRNISAADFSAYVKEVG